MASATFDGVCFWSGQVRLFRSPKFVVLFLVSIPVYQVDMRIRTPRSIERYQNLKWLRSCRASSSVLASTVVRHL